MILLSVLKKKETNSTMFRSKLESKVENLKVFSRSSKLLFKENNSVNIIKPKYDLIGYIITIKFSQANTFINVTDTNGRLKLLLSSGLMGLAGRQKKLQPVALITLLKSLLLKGKFLLSKPIAIHFKNSKPFHEFIVINLLKKFFFIKSIRSYNLHPHNGCRPKKLRRLKSRTKR